MSDKRVYCEICRDDVPYLIEEKEMVGRIRGEEYTYTGREAKCAVCGAFVDVPEISESNLESLYDVYRREKGLVTLDRIRNIPEKYAIGKRPLSVLLGWGEQTFTRFYDGDVPSRQYSEILDRIFEDPSYYLCLLDENRDRLKSDLSYRKSRKAAECLIHQKMTYGEKCNDVINYLLDKCEDITPLALQKSLYYVQGFFFAFFGRFLLSEDCQAWAHGPVYQNVYSQLADYRFDPISAAPSFDGSVFSSQEIAVMDSVIKNICCYSGKVLESFTHNESPWLETRGELPAGAASDKIISKELIGDYFQKVRTRYSMDTPMDIRLYTSDLFRKLC